MDEIELKGLLSHLPLGEVRYLDVTGSTNDDALAWLEDGAPDASLVVTSHQTKGRGRMDHTWHSQSEASLTFSLIFQPQMADSELLSFFAPMAGLAVCKALEQNLGLFPEIKWPNDVLMDRKKAAGILSEALWIGNKCMGVVVGIGVNIAPSSMPPDVDLPIPATCLEMAAGKKINRWDVLVWIVEQILIEKQSIGSAEFLQDWERRLAYLEEKVQILPPTGSSVNGMVKGISPSGCLRIALDNGTTIEVEAGDVHLRPVVE